MTSKKITSNDIQDDCKYQMLTKFLGQADPDQFKRLGYSKLFYLRQSIQYYQEDKIKNENWRSLQEAQSLLHNRELEFKKQRQEIRRKLQELTSKPKKVSIQQTNKNKQIIKKVSTNLQPKQQKGISQVQYFLQPFKKMFQRNYGIEQTVMLKQEDEQKSLFERQRYHLKKQ